ncbi:MerR family transcriptional regulator [Cytophagaceae bacterium ABcell3]|nr:MerR family transcriptional regulator [Cytophagaceae bacterium ABcell3]
MGRYSIKDLEQLSGIKAHTIRIWEQRYNLLSPQRTDTNIRYYNDADLRLVLNVALLKEKGYKISRIIKMGTKRIGEEVYLLSQKNSHYPNQIHALTMAMLEINEEQFEKTLSTSIIHFGFEQTMLNIIYPFLEKIGFLWQAGTINTSHEHFISNLIRQKIIVAIDGLLLDSQGEKYMLFLPEGELHEISLLFSYYILKSRKKKVIYLGQSLPLQDLETAWAMHQPSYLFTVITSHPTMEELQSYINNLSAKFSSSTIILAGQQLLQQQIQLPPNTLSMTTPNDLINHLKK